MQILDLANIYLPLCCQPTATMIDLLQRIDVEMMICDDVMMM